jgi:serine protease AprX
LNVFCINTTLGKRIARKRFGSTDALFCASKIMDDFFSNLHKDREVQEGAGRLIGRQRSDSKDEEALYLELFYSSSLSHLPLRDISLEKVQSLLHENSQAQLPHLVRYHLDSRLARRGGRGQQLFSRSFRRKEEADLIKLIGSRLERSFLRELQATHVLCSNSEFQVLPTPLRLDADPRFTGKGVCIAFMDGGFYPHPDLMKPMRRVVAYKDLGSPERPKSNFEKPDELSWHGMQTSVSAVGNGFLSGGLYKGIAHEAKVALLKVADEDSFTTDAIVAAIEWCIRKQKRYNIRVINISLGTDEGGSFRESAINHAAEEAVQAGINVVVAAGNDAYSPVTPPGNSPSVITVGGLDDRNSLSPDGHGMYHSSFGVDVDGTMKPEILAPGIWIAAPTLPGTTFYRSAEIIWNLSHASSSKSWSQALGLAKTVFAEDSQTCDMLEKPREQQAEFWKQKVSEYKLVSAYYQHVDGTSFSAPIICSIIAQLLEANPSLGPKNVKEILMETARRIPDVPVEQQGCGVVQARSAVDLASKRVYSVGFEYPVVRDTQVRLRYVDGSAKSVEVVGSFNQWGSEAQKMSRNQDGEWEFTLELPGQGTYGYKFLVNGSHWVDDPLNLDKTYDGYGGFNSSIHIYGTSTTRDRLKAIELELDSIASVKHEGVRHKKGLLELDEIIAFECIAKSPQVKDFYEQRIRRALKGLSERKVENGMFLYQLYNSGYIIQTPTLNIGIDIVSGRHVWDLYWDVDPALFQKLTDLLDIAFVTHRLPDHLDLDVVNRMITRDKLVVVPSGMENLCLNGVIGFEPGEKRDLYSLGRENISLNIEAFDGVFRMMSASDIDLRCYQISIQERFNILHIGEHGYGGFDRIPGDPFFNREHSPVDILICPLPLSDDPKALKSFLSYIERLDPDVIIPSHIAELGQKDPLLRGSYQRAYELLERTGKEFEVLIWGDSIKIGHS